MRDDVGGGELWLSLADGGVNGIRDVESVAEMPLPCLLS